MAQPLVVYDGVVDRIIHIRADDGHTVAALATEVPDGTIRIAGVALAGIQPGETLQVRGAWNSHPRHGPTMRVTSCEHILPASLHAIRCYLGSGLIKGIGPVLAREIVDHFSTDTITVIDTAPQRLREVRGIGPTRASLIAAGWQAQRELRELMMFLQGIGITPSLAVRIHKHLGPETMTIVKTQPYRLIEEVTGVGFLTADAIALKMGLPEQSPQRLQEALIHVLDKHRGRGDCYVYYSSLVTEAAALVRQDFDLVAQALQRLRDQRRVVIEDTPPGTAPGEDGLAVYLVWLHKAECDMAASITRLRTSVSTAPRALTDRILDTAHQPPLSAPQVEAIHMALGHTVSILTGGPGCGKSHTVGALTRHVTGAGGSITLAAPTGRAAKRLTDLTGLPAKTVHRLVSERRAARSDGALFGLADPLDTDVLVIDEASMLDVTIAAKLLAEIASGTHLLLVGDVDQLPSVGPGNLLRDLLAVAPIPRARLSTVYRTGPGSQLVDTARQVVGGRFPDNNPEFWFYPVGSVASSEQTAEQVIDIAVRRLPEAFGVAAQDVQVLCPSNRAATGAPSLNRLLQDKLNPVREEHPEHWSGHRPFRVGDKVMPIRNDYTKGTHGVFNGATGTVISINAEDHLLHVLLDDGQRVSYAFDELDDLAHAYAITVHRSQGSEYPMVVIPLTRDVPNILRQRNLLYTAITRAKKYVVLVAEHDILRDTLKNVARRRRTLLTSRLGEAPPRRGLAAGQQYSAF